jgi:hypothetical protein
MTNALQDAFVTAKAALMDGIQLPFWMTSGRDVREPRTNYHRGALCISLRQSFMNKFMHMIIGKRGVKDGEVQIGKFTDFGIPIRLPEGHPGFGWPEAVRFNSTKWSEVEIETYWE